VNRGRIHLLGNHLTRLMTDSIRDYLNLISRYPLLTATQEIELSRQVQDMLAITAEHPTKIEQRIIKRGRKARDTLINCNLRLVVYIAKRYTKRLNGNNMEMLDLIQEGTFGLHRAAEKFDPARGYKFSTYSYWWIKQAIGRAIDTQEKIIRLPGHKLDLVYAALKYRSECIKTEGSASIAAMAAHVGITPDDMSMLLSRYAMTRSLDELCTDGGDTTLLELVADEQIVDDEVQQSIREEHVQLAFFRLNPQDRSLLSRRYGLRDDYQQTLQSMADEDGVCRERIRQRLKVAQNRLRAVMATERLTA
jgi:RNA polymerase sigma factor, sigma-70 family